MPDAQLPPRPLSPWPVGAGILGTFVALAIFFDDSTTAIQFMIIGSLLIGLLLVRHVSKSRQSTLGKALAPSPGGEAPPPVAPRASRHAVLTLAEAASYLRSDIDEVAAEMEAGRMPGNRLGGRWLVRTEALDAWLDGAYGHAGQRS
jgi:excisionase family DNA binding protein